VEASALAPECGNAKPFVERTSQDAANALAELDALDAAVSSLKAEAESLKKSETALPTLKRNLRG
jgi:prefoldin subunit 5